MYDAVCFDLLGLTVYPYGLFAAAGMAACVLLFAALGKSRGQKPGTAALFGLLSVPVALVLSRALFVVMDESFREIPKFPAAFDLFTGGYSMFGALLGMVISALLTAKLTGQRAKRLLDTLAAPMCAFIALARYGEKYTTLGVSRPLDTDWLIHSFLATEGEYNSYLRTYYLEFVAALVLMLVFARLLQRNGRDGDCALSSMMIFGAVQTLMESLRYDHHMSFNFIGIQQVFAIVLLCAGIIVFTLRAYRATRNKKTLWALVSVPVGVALGVGLEFVIDRIDISRFIDYALFILLLAGMTAVGFAMKKRSEAQ